MGAAAAFNPVLTDADVKLSESAMTKMAELFDSVEDDLDALRVFVSGGGCGGMTYGMTFTDTKTPYDCVLEATGFNLYVDSMALSYLRGVEIDYVERPSGSSFVFNNVFAATGGSGACGGCGSAGGGCG